MGEVSALDKHGKAVLICSIDRFANQSAVNNERLSFLSWTATVFYKHAGEWKNSDKEVIQ